MKRALLLTIVLCLSVSKARAQSAREVETREHEAAEKKADELLAASDLPEGTQSVTLAEALRLARKRNLTLKQIEMEIEKADARLRQAKALLFPVVQAQLRYIVADHPDEVSLMGAPTIVVNPRHNVNGDVTLNLPLVNLSNWRKVDISKDSSELTQLSVAEMRQSILYGTAQAYFSAMMSKTLVAVYRNQIVASRAHLRVAEEKFYAGSGLRIDMLRATIDFEQAEEDLLNARLSLASACDALGVLIGAKGMVSPKSADALRAPEETKDALEQDAVSNRIDLKIKQKNEAILVKQIESSLADLFPSLNLMWQGTYQFTEPGDFGDTDRSRWNIVLALSIPLFNYYSYGKIRESKAMRRQSEIEVEVLEQSVGQEVRQAKREHETALINVRGAERRVRLAEESLQLAEAAYAAGAGTSLDVTDARRMYLQAEVNLAATELKTQLTLLTLLQSIGEKPARIVK